MGVRVAVELLQREHIRSQNLCRHHKVAVSHLSEIERTNEQWKQREEMRFGALRQHSHKLILQNQTVNERVQHLQQLSAT